MTNEFDAEQKAASECPGYIPDATKDGVFCAQCGLDIMVFQHRPTAAYRSTAIHPRKDWTHEDT
jgi:hypothetical protein